LEKQAIIEWKKGKQTSDHVLRNYAYGNLYEFFAVSVEYFFEKSRALQAAAPQLYMELERLLRLDPLNYPDPIIHHLPVHFSFATHSASKYNPIDLLKKIFESPKNFLCFIAGSVCWWVEYI